MSEMRSDRPEDVPPEDQGPRYGRRGYGDDEGAWAWWWWVLGIIVIGLIIWWIVAAATPNANQRVATGPAYGTGGQTGTGGGTAGGGTSGGTAGGGTAGGTAAGSRTGTGGTVSATTVTIPAILSNPNQYMGRAVSVRGVVGQTVGTNGFVLQSQSTGGASAGQGVLVYGQSQLVQSAQPNQSVQVVGTVQRFSTANLQRVAGRQANLQQFRSWQNRPAIQAGSVTMLNPPSGQSGSGTQSGGAQGSGTQSGGTGSSQGGGY